MFSKKLTTLGNVDVLENSSTTATSFTIDRHERSPLEFEGELLFESDGSEATGYQAGEPRYRIRVYCESHRDFVLEIALVADDRVMFQTAEFTQSVAEVDDLLCLVHKDAMNGLADSGQLDASRKKTLDQSLEAELCRLSIQVVERLTKI